MPTRHSAGVLSRACAVQALLLAAACAVLTLRAVVDLAVPRIIPPVGCQIYPLVTSYANATALDEAYTGNPRGRVVLPLDGTRWPGALLSADASAVGVEEPSYVVDRDALWRCAPTASDAMRLHGSACRNSSGLEISLVRAAFSTADATVWEVTVSVRVPSVQSQPLSGFLLRGELLCVNCVPSAKGRGRHPIHVIAYSHDNCDGTYEFGFEGLVALATDQQWALKVRVDFANFEHYTTTARLCMRSLPGVLPLIPDGPDGTRGCGAIRTMEYTVLDHVHFGDLTPVAASPAAIASLPVCGAGADNMPSGRWLVRSHAYDVAPDRSLCRAGQQRPDAGRLWTVEDYVWCPYACRLWYYSAADVAQCFARKGIRKVLFAGDSRTRNLFHDAGARALFRGEPLPRELFHCPVGGSCFTFDAYAATFDAYFTWGFFEQRAAPCIPPACEHERLDPSVYFERRLRGYDGGMQAFERQLAQGYDVLVFGEGMHVIQPFFTDDDVELLVRTALDVARRSPRPPRVIVFHTTPAVVDIGSATREITRAATLNRRAVAALRRDYPELLVLDMLAMTATRGDRFFDAMHYFPSEPPKQDPEAHELLVGSEMNLALLNLLCNDALAR